MKYSQSCRFFSPKNSANFQDLKKCTILVLFFALKIVYPNFFRFLKLDRACYEMSLFEY